MLPRWRTRREPSRSWKAFITRQLMPRPALTALAQRAQCRSMDEFLRRWWRQSWAPFALVALGAIILSLVGYDFTDALPIMLMIGLIFLLAAGIARRIERTSIRRPSSGSWH